MINFFAGIKVFLPPFGNLKNGQKEIGGNLNGNRATPIITLTALAAGECAVPSESVSTLAQAEKNIDMDGNAKDGDKKSPNMILSAAAPSAATPDAKRARLSAAAAAALTPGAASLTPRSTAMLKIPHSPCLERLGYGTGEIFFYRHCCRLSLYVHGMHNR